MAISRYNATSVLELGTKIGTSYTINNIRSAIRNNSLAYVEYVTKGGDRLDTIAGFYYGESSYWWMIAAASNIGWGLQIPPGTYIKIPSLAGAIALLG